MLHKVWEFIKARRKSTIVFVISFILLILSVGMFQLILTVQAKEIAIYINEIEANGEGNLTPVMPSLVAFGFVCFMGTVWGLSLLAVMLRGAKKTLFTPLKNDVRRITGLFDTDILNRRDKKDQ